MVVYYIIYAFQFQFVQFSKTPNSLRAAPTSVRFLASDVHNDEKSIDSCGKAKTLDKKDKILREKTPIGKLEELEGASHPFQEKEPLAPFPGGVNPKTGNLFTENLISHQSDFYKFSATL